MNRGFHAFFRQYYNLRALLRRVDPALSMLDRGRRLPADRRARPARHLPRATAHPAVERAGVRLAQPDVPARATWPGSTPRAAAPLAAVSVPDIYHRLDHVDAETFLKGINFPDAARHLAFEVFSRSFFAEPADLSAAELATMFHIYFLGSSEGLIFDVANANFDAALWNPLRQYLEACGVRFHTGVSVDQRRSVAADGIPRRRPTPASRSDADARGAGHRCGWPAAHRRGVTRARRRRLAGANRRGCAPPRRSWCSGCGWTGRWRRPSGVPRDGRPTAAGQHQRAGTLRTRSRRLGPAHRWFRRRVALVRSAGAARRLRDAHAGPAARAVPGDRQARGWSTNACCAATTARCSRPGTYADRPTRRHSATRRLVLAGDGIRIDLPVALMERAATTGWTAANQLLAAMGLAGHELSHGSHPGPLGAAALCSRAEKGVRGHEHRRRTMTDAAGPTTGRCGNWPIPPGSWMGRQRPTYRDASRQIIDAALDRSQRRPSGNWYAFAASRDVRSGRPFGTRVAGTEMVAWRDQQPGCASARAACPHLGVPTCATAAVDCGALICRWHGLRLERDTGEFGWRALPSYDDGVLAWVRLDSVGGEEPLDQPVVPARPAGDTLDAVATMVGTCEPSDIIANRLDPWHGAWYHPYFAHFGAVAPTRGADHSHRGSRRRSWSR